MGQFKPIANSPFTRLGQVSAVVKDREKAIEYYASLGIGPFSPPRQVAKYTEFRGKPVELNLREVMTNMGPIDFEIIPPPEVPSLYHEFLEKKGEGLHHLGFLVEDINQAEQNLIRQGFKVIQKGRSDQGGYSYIETDAIGGIIFELIQRPPGVEIQKTSPENTPFAEIKTLGVVVRDIDRAIDYYTSLGIGPFKPVPMQLSDKWFKGEPAQFRSKAMMAKLEPVGFELIQPVVGPSSFFEFMDKKGEGIHHIGFFAEDLDAEEEKLVKKGVKVRQKARGVNCGFTHFETSLIGGVTFELLKMLEE